MEENCSSNYTFCWDNKPEAIAYLYIHLPVALIGMITNILNLFVLHQRPFRARVTAFTLLRAMAVADLLTCFFIFPIGLCRCLKPDYNSWKTVIQQFYEIFVYIPFANWFGCVSVWLTVFVSIERYLSVAHALYARHCWTIRTIHWIIFLTYILALVMNIPTFFTKQINSVPPPVYTDWGKSHGALIYSWCRLVLIKAIPLLIVAIINALLIRAIWKINTKRDNMSQSVPCSSRHQMQMRATAMVVSISIVFLSCHLLDPFASSGVFASLFGVCNVYGPGHKLLSVSANIIELFSYASNFFFYCIFNRIFRSALKDLLSNCCTESNDIAVNKVTPTQ